MPPDSKAVINAKALSREIVASMSIENDNVPFDCVFSSVAKHFALDVDSRIKSNNRAESVSKIAIDIQSNKDILTKERLFSWHKMTKCPSATATRDLTDLVNKKALIRLGEGSRNIRYVLNLKFIP